MAPNTVLLAVFCIVTLAACDRETDKRAAAPATTDCCQCSGKTNPNPPPAYTINPDCNPTGWTNTTCDKVCATLGHSSGAIFKGSCVAATPPGVGNICK